MEVSSAVFLSANQWAMKLFELQYFKSYQITWRFFLLLLWYWYTFHMYVTPHKHISLCYVFMIVDVVVGLSRAAGCLADVAMLLWQKLLPSANSLLYLYLYANYTKILIKIKQIFNSFLKLLKEPQPKRDMMALCVAWQTRQTASMALSFIEQ